MLELELHNKGRIGVADISTKDILKRGFYGTYEKDELTLSVEEAMYLLDVRNANCTRAGVRVSFSDLASKFWKSDKFMARYFTYKDWRERGLVAVSTEQRYKEPSKTPVKKYPSSSLRLPRKVVHGIFFKTDLMTMVKEEDAGKFLYENFWFGQYGSYKAADRGRLDKLDAYETLFLLEKKALELENTSKAELIKYAVECSAAGRI